jgi:ATP synthase F1 complex assembly factor 1
MLSQDDAQLLAMEVQKFYLWGTEGKGREAERLLKVFHERPEEFQWEELLKHADLSL